MPKEPPSLTTSPAPTFPVPRLAALIEHEWAEELAAFGGLCRGCTCQADRDTELPFGDRTRGTDGRVFGRAQVGLCPHQRREEGHRRVHGTLRPPRLSVPRGSCLPRLPVGLRTGPPALRGRIRPSTCRSALPQNRPSSSPSQSADQVTLNHQVSAHAACVVATASGIASCCEGLT